MPAKKRAGFTQDEISALDNLSIEQLDQLILSSRGTEANKASAEQRAPGFGGGSSIQPQLPLDQQSDIAQQDLFQKQVQLDNDDSLDAIAMRNFDPATLEEMPSFADGSAPEKALHKTPEGASWERFKLAFSNKPMGERLRYLEEAYGKGNVALSKGNNITVRRPDNQWYQLDPIGAGEGDWFDKSLEKTRDVLVDNADIALSVGAGIATAGLAAPALAGLGGAGLLAAKSGIALAGGANSAMSRILMGRLAGTYEATPEEMIKDIGVESLLSLGGEMFIPGLKYGARELGAKFIKAAPALQQASPGAKDAMAKVIGYTSGVGEEVADHWVNNADKVGRQIAKYGRDEQAAIMANISQTKDIAQGIIQARNKYGQELYGNFAKEAGEEFAPWVGKVFSSSNVKDEISLIKDGILKWDGKNSQLLLNSADDIIKANPTTGSIFQNKESRKALNLVVNEINQFNKLRPAVGEEGSRQFIAFKQRINNAVNKAITIAQDSGDNEAIRHLKEFQAQVKTSYLQKAVDATRAPKLAEKLAGIDKQYADMKTVIKPFEEAVKRGGSSDLAAYKNLYDSTFGGVNLTTKKAIAKNQLQQTLQTLGKYKPELTEMVDDIGARKAALASVPWFRKGMIGQAAAFGSAVTLNPAMMAGAAATSPKLNFQAAKLASSMYDGMDFIRKMSPEMKTQFLKSPEAVSNFYKTVTSVPGIEAQLGAQLGNKLRGGQ